MAGTLKFNIEAIPSTLRVTGGREIPFVRAILSLSNTGDTKVSGVVTHATFSEERGLVHDAMDTLRRAVSSNSILPGGELKWDVYEMLLAAHPGVASKVHLWGYKAILNWWIELSAWAEHIEQGEDKQVQTGVSRWKLRWAPAEPFSEKIELTVEDVADKGAG